MTRRSLIPATLGAALLGAAGSASGQGEDRPVPRKGRLKQSATGGTFGRGRSVEERCRIAAQLGLKGLDVQGAQPNDFATLKKYGLTPALIASRGAINHKQEHEAAEKAIRLRIDQAAEASAPNVGLTFGTRTGYTDEEGMDSSVAFLKRVKAAAEDKGVTIVLEPLNSKVDHPDNQGDHTRWVAEICRRTDSPRVKILFDIYHMQVMEGDIIRTIRENISLIAHFHTAGVPGRHEIDETQELNYRAIAQAIVDLNYTGFLAHEYVPLQDPVKSLDKAISICDV